MREISWDQELAHLAELWAAQCPSSIDPVRKAINNGDVEEVRFIILFDICELICIFSSLKILSSSSCPLTILRRVWRRLSSSGSNLRRMSLPPLSTATPSSSVFCNIYGRLMVVKLILVVLQGYKPFKNY